MHVQFLPRRESHFLTVLLVVCLVLYLLQLRHDLRLELCALVLIFVKISSEGFLSISCDVSRIIAVSLHYCAVLAVLLRGCLGRGLTCIWKKLRSLETRSRLRSIRIFDVFLCLHLFFKLTMLFSFRLLFLSRVKHRFQAVVVLVLKSAAHLGAAFGHRGFTFFSSWRGLKCVFHFLNFSLTF